MKNILIQTKRLILKSPVNFVSPTVIVNAINKHETLQYLSSVPAVYTEKDAEIFIAFLKSAADDPAQLELGMFTKDKDQFIGMMSLEDITVESAELGYWLAYEFSGQGLAYEAASALLFYAKNTLRLKLINAFVMKENQKSIALLERLGFSRIKLLLNNIKNKGVLVDRYLYELEV